MANTTSNQKKLNYLHNLVAIAQSDGVICPRELQFLRTEATSIGISVEYLDYITSVGYATIFNVPDSITERLEYLEKCVQMAMIDANLHKDEYDVCVKVCKMLNLDNSILDELISFHKVHVIQ